MVEPPRTPEEIRSILADLAALQEIDREAIQIRQQLAGLPAKLRTLDARLTQEEQALNEAGQGKTDTHQERRVLEGEIRELEQSIEQHRKRQMEVKTNKEYAAVDREIEILRQKIDALETRVLEMIEDEDTHESQATQAHERFERLRVEIQEERQRIQEQIRSKKEKIARLSVERERRRDRIPPDALRIYDRLSERHPGDVVVPAVRNHCGGCHISLVSQKMVEIRQMKDFVRCEGCLRLFSGEAES